MQTVPNHIVRQLRVPSTRSAALVAREVAARYGVTSAQLRSSSRRAPLPDARRDVARKASRMGASNAEIARVLRVDPSHVSRLIGGLL